MASGGDSRVSFDPTISLGTVLQLFAIVAGLWGLTRRLARLELQVDLMWQEFSRRFDMRGPPRQRNGD
jgi:hypothetical protein